MKGYIFYDASGTIRQFARCLYGDALANAEAQGLMFIECENSVNQNEFRVINGKLINLLDGPVADKNQNYESSNFLELSKGLAIARIKQMRSEVISAPISMPFGVFQCDKNSALNILKTSLYAQNLAAKGLPSDVEFTLADNTRPTFSMEQITSVAMAMGAREAAAYATAQSLREQIDAATTPEQLEAIQWPASS